MGIAYNPSIVLPGLEILLDPGNIKSYSGSGTTWRDISSNSIFGASVYTYPSFVTSGNNKYFTFVNNGTTVNNVYSSTITTTTSTASSYTRTGWFYLTGTSGWSPIIANQIGNNTDMCLAVSGGRLTFRQYTRTNTSGTTDLDYGVTGNAAVNINTWYYGAMCVNRVANQVTFYLNGVLDVTVSINVIGTSSSNNIIIGGSYSDSYGGDRMFKGNIGMVSHYNRILTASEIQQNFSASRGRYGI